MADTPTHDGSYCPVTGDPCDCSAPCRTGTPTAKMVADNAALRAALRRAEDDMRYAADVFLKARRMRPHHTMVAAADEVRSALAKLRRD